MRWFCVFSTLLCSACWHQAAADQRDSLLSIGQARLAEGRADAAVAAFSQLVEAFPNDAQSWSRLGYAYLKQRDFDAASAAFKEAKKRDGNLAEAYVGLGLVYAERPAAGMAAYSNFRKAIGEAKRASKIDSTHAPAYRLLGELYQRFQEDHQKAVAYYLKYIQAESDNPEGLYYFGLACVQAEQYDLIVTHLIPYIAERDPEPRLLPLAALGHFFDGKPELALDSFDRYLQRVGESERAYHTDISLVASEREWREYQGLADEAEKRAYVQRFWQRRDPDILTPVNERVA